MHGLHYHDGIIDHEADRRRDPSQGHQVKAETADQHGHQGNKHRDRDDQHGGKGNAPVLEEKIDDD